MIIAHCADIHIRSLSRHDEYREAFEAFTEDCKRERVDHIFVGGDIFHTKTTGISPEYIDLLTWWLTSMSRVAPVHMILGNHDGNLVNLSRQDAVSPIVDALGDPRIKLYKNSGVYPIEQGINLCVFSIFDEPGWDRVQPVPGDINIACYHGPVWGCKTETDWDVEDGLKASFFSQYDFTFLGDIHKRQFLDFRNEKAIMAYPGTLLQQNYAEDLEHGYLIWDIKDRNTWDVSYRSIPNLMPFVTLDWGGSVDELLTRARQFPTRSRFRVRSSIHISQADISNLTGVLKREMNATEVTFKSDYQPPTTDVITHNNFVINRSNLRESDTLAALMKGYYAGSSGTEFQWDDIGSQIKSYLSAVSVSDESVRGSKWSIKSLKFDNLFSYGEGNEINFESLDGVVGIFGPNRAGKSSLVGSLMYSLFNTTDRGPMKNLYVCNMRKQYCISQCVVTIDGIDYLIERQTTKVENKKGVVNAPTSLNLFQIGPDGSKTDLCGEQRNDTEKTLRRLIGTAEDFLLTSLSSQGEINQFISYGSTKRKQMISKFLDLDIFEKMADLSNKDLNSLKSQLKILPEKDWDFEVINTNERIKLSDERLTLNLQRIQELNDELNLLKFELSQHSDFSPVSPDTVEGQRKKVQSLKDKIRTELGEIETLNVDIVKITDKSNKISELSRDNNLPLLKEQLKTITLLEGEVSKLQFTLDKDKRALEGYKKSSTLLSEVPCGTSFPTCKFISDAHASSAKIRDQEGTVYESVLNLERAVNELSALSKSDIADKIDKVEKLLDMNTKLTVDLSKRQARLSVLQSSIDGNYKSLSEEEERLRCLDESLRGSENIEVISIRRKSDECLKTIRQIEAENLRIAADNGRLSSELERLSRDRSVREDLLLRMKSREVISTAFSRKGIPSSIVRTQIPLINAEISKILGGIVDFSVEIENDEDSDSLEIYINYGDSRRIIELGSGMEKMISSVAIRVALINVSTLPKTNIFILDEGFGALDALAVESCNRLLQSLKRYFKTVFVITHIDGIKDCADTTIEISKVEKDSKVHYV